MITDAAQLAVRPRIIHDRAIIAGFMFLGFAPLLNGVLRLRYRHDDGRTCFTDVDRTGNLLTTTVDLTGRVNINQQVRIG